MNRFVLALALSFPGLVCAQAFYPTAVEVLLPNVSKSHSYRIEMVAIGDAYGIRNVGMRKTGDGYETVLGPTNDRESYRSPKATVLAEGKGGMLSSIGAKLDGKQLTSIGSAIVHEALHSFRDPRVSGVEIQLITVKSPATVLYNEVKTVQAIARYSIDKDEWTTVEVPGKNLPAFELRFVE